MKSIPASGDWALVVNSLQNYLRARSLAVPPSAQPPHAYYFECSDYRKVGHAHPGAWRMALHPRRNLSALRQAQSKSAIEEGLNMQVDVFARLPNGGLISHQQPSSTRVKS
jgi:hypothetical protein